MVHRAPGRYVDRMAHTNGMESFWSTLKRSYHGTCHWFSHKHLKRYVAQFAAKHNRRDENTADQMIMVACGMTGRKLTYAKPITGRRKLLTPVDIEWVEL